MNIRFVFFILLSVSFNSSELTAQNFKGKEIGTLVVGVVLPLSGPQAAYGQEAMAGIRLALEDIEKSQPRYRRLIKLETADEKSTASGAAAAGAELVRKRVSVLLGSVTGVASAALTEVAEASGKPLVIPATSTLSVGKESGSVFRSCSVDRWQGHLLAEFALRSLNKKKAAVLLNPRVTFSHDVAEYFTRNIKKNGGKIVYKALYHAEKTDFKEYLAKIKASGAEVLLFPTASVAEAAEVMESMQGLKMNLPLLGVDRWHSQTLRRTAGKAWPGHYYILPYSADDPDVRNQEFVKRFQAKVGRFPSPLGAMSYDAMMLIADSFIRAGTTRAPELRRSLTRTKGMKGLTGPLSMNDSRTAEKSGVVMMTTGQGSVFRTRVHPM